MESINKTKSRQRRLANSRKEVLLDSSIISLANANRLITNAEFLNFDTDTFPTSYALAFLAQEETAKAFLLYLVYSEALPWNQHIQRSLKDHTCKQLWFVVLDALNPDIDTFLEKVKEPCTFGIGAFMSKVGDMLNWYRYAKIDTWEKGYYDWAESPSDEDIKHIIKGKLDKRKQDALYVKIGNRGEVVSIPGSIKEKDASLAIETAKRFYGFVDSLINSFPDRADNECLVWLKQALRYIFTPSVRIGREVTDAIPGIRFFEVRQPIIRISKKQQRNQRPGI